MTFISLFAGIGGFDLGFERAGMRCVGQVEIDNFCRKVLKKHWPDVPRWRDVRNFKASMLSEKPDVICGGFPCQDISSAGKRKGLGGERSGLWYEYLRIICEVRPKFVVVENVEKLLVRGIDAILGGLAEIGYDAEWTCVSAAAFGAPHERQRIVLVAYPNGSVCERGLLFDNLHEIPRDVIWGATKDIKSGGKWKRWLMEACAAVDWSDPNRFFRRVDDGLPKEVDEIHAYGNSVLPQIAEWVGKRIMREAACV